MLCFDETPRRFQYRIVAVALHEGRVLLHRGDDDEFWSLPGGRAEQGETSEETLVREMREELATEVSLVRPLWFVENFFAYQHRAVHEIALYFLVQLHRDFPHFAPDATFRCAQPSEPFTFRWFPTDRETLAGLPLLPSFLQEELSRLPERLEHRVHRDDPRGWSG
ncbi:MAG: NUDIX hydrolase [Planctomycetaceae bacterium]|nr:NUDIX hydrolase [Planctomycetaceae bacterium]